MADPEHPLGSTLPELCEVMRRLLAPDGCPWDREQTLSSLEPYLLEETYEVLDALRRDSPIEHCEELGDLLLQIVFHAALRQSEGAFDMDDVVCGIVDKLVRRHPHVFAESNARTADEVHAQWDRIKRQEKAARADADADARPVRVLDGVPLALPALARAQKLTERAARVGFDWPDVSGPRAKVDEELGELDEARAQVGADRDTERVEEELGDLLFATVNLARKLGLDAERALRGATQRFEDRFEYIEERLADQGRSMTDASLDELDDLWTQAKS